MNSPLVALIVLIAGLCLMIFSSKKTIDHVEEVASAYGIPHIVIGFILIAMGTNLPEIVNSILSSYLEHADIIIDDSLGSVLSQLTLVFGLLPIIGGAISRQALSKRTVSGPCFRGRCQWGRQEIGWFPSLFCHIFAPFDII